MSPKNNVIVQYEKKDIELNCRELALILALRNKFRFGEVIVLVRDGIPQRLKQVEIFDDLTEI